MATSQSKSHPSKKKTAKKTTPKKASASLITSDKKCRVCSKKPDGGLFYASRARRHDWICPRCCNKHAKKMRVQAGAK